MHAGRRYDAMGFGNLFTFHPTAAKAWLAVLREATDFILNSAADVGILFCNPALESFYAAADGRGVVTHAGAEPGDDESAAIRMMLYISEAAARANPISRNGRSSWTGCGDIQRSQTPMTGKIPPIISSAANRAWWKRGSSNSASIAKTRPLPG